MPLIQALHGLTKSTENNATPRVNPYGVVSHTILHSTIIHSIGVHNENQDIQKRLCHIRKTVPIGYVFSAMLYRL
jgi:hypothetical protein